MILTLSRRSWSVDCLMEIFLNKYLLGCAAFAYTAKIFINKSHQ